MNSTESNSKANTLKLKRLEQLGHLSKRTIQQNSSKKVLQQVQLKIYRNQT